MTPDPTLRLPTCYADDIARHAQAALPNETAFFLLCSRMGDCGLVARELILPAPGDLDIATPGLVEASPSFKRAVWRRALKENHVLVDGHVHAPPVPPDFSATDWHGFKENAVLVRTEFPTPVPFVGLVIDPTFTRFSGTLWNPARDEFDPIRRVERVGSRPAILLGEGASEPETRPAAGRYARQRLIPGFDQDALARLRVAVVGAGGTGAQILVALAAMGVATAADGLIVLVEGDRVSRSNLNRLIYACSPDVIARNKAEVAAELIRRFNPNVNVVALPEFLTADSYPDLVASCTVVIGCGDNDGLRRLLIENALAFSQVLIDAGCEIRSASDGDYESGGQVRILLPGETGCAACFGLIDFAQAALDLLPEDERRTRRARGYLDGKEVPTASVIHLNAMTGALVTNLLCRLIAGDDLRSYALTGFDARTFATFHATMPSSQECVLCGPMGPFGRGDAWRNGSRSTATAQRPPALEQPEVEAEPAVTSSSACSGWLRRLFRGIRWLRRMVWR